MNSSSHPEERPKGASRRTHGGDATGARTIAGRCLTFGAIAATLLAVGAVIFASVPPPDLARLQDRSTLVVDSDGKLLRAYTTADGKWRLPATASDVDPRYLAMLRGYEDKRFDSHFGIDPLAIARAG